MGESAGDTERLGEAPLHFVCYIRLSDGTTFEREYGPYPNTTEGNIKQAGAQGFVVGWAAGQGVPPEDLAIRVYVGDEIVQETGFLKS